MIRWWTEALKIVWKTVTNSTREWLKLLRINLLNYLKSNTVLDAASGIQELALAENLRRNWWLTEWIGKDNRWAEIDSYLTASGGGETVDPNERGVTDGLHEPVLPWYVLLLGAAVTDEIGGESDWDEDCDTNTNGACASRCHRRHFFLSTLCFSAPQPPFPTPQTKSKLLGFLSCLDHPFLLAHLQWHSPNLLLHLRILRALSF